MERLADRRRDVLGARHQVVVLGDRQRDAGDVGFLERVASRSACCRTWPVMQTIGDESIIAVAMPVTRLVAPGPEVAIATPTLPRRARVAVGHVRGALLVPDQDVADRVVEHRVVGGQDRPARIAEDDVTPSRTSDSQRICAPVRF